MTPSNGNRPPEEEEQCQGAPSAYSPRTWAASCARRKLVQYFEAMEEGVAVDAQAFDALLRHSVSEVVRRQQRAGIDIVSDGEYGKPRSELLRPSTASPASRSAISPPVGGAATAACSPSSAPTQRLPRGAGSASRRLRAHACGPPRHRGLQGRAGGRRKSRASCRWWPGKRRADVQERALRSEEAVPLVALAARPARGYARPSSDRRRHQAQQGDDASAGGSTSMRGAGAATGGHGRGRRSTTRLKALPQEKVHGYRNLLGAALTPRT